MHHQTYFDTPYSVGLLWMSDRPLRRDLYLTTRNTRKRHTSMPPAGSETTIPTSERLQTHALDRADSEGKRTQIFVCLQAPNYILLNREAWVKDLRSNYIVFLNCRDFKRLDLEQSFSTFVRPRPGKFFFHKTRARSQQIYSSVPFPIFFLSSYIKLT